MTKQKIAVIGMARPGTTLMARSLDQIPGVRMCSFEVFNPNLQNRVHDVAKENLPAAPADTGDVAARSRWFNEQVLPALREQSEMSPACHTRRCRRADSHDTSA
jgi:hypothetical protein